MVNRDYQLEILHITLTKIWLIISNTIKLHTIKIKVCIKTIHPPILSIHLNIKEIRLLLKTANLEESMIK